MSESQDMTMARIRYEQLQSLLCTITSKSLALLPFRNQQEINFNLTSALDRLSKENLELYSLLEKRGLLEGKHE